LEIFAQEGFSRASIVGQITGPSDGRVHLSVKAC